MSLPHFSALWMRPVLPFGSWPSPLSAAALAAGSLSLSQVKADASGVYWIEGRPQEGGRQVLVRWRDGAASDVTAAPFNVRSRVHEYGGGAYALAPGLLCFSHDLDRQVYLQRGAHTPQQLSAATDVRFADFEFDVARGRIVCVKEQHHSASPEPRNSLVALGYQDAGREITLAQGADFYSDPRLSRDGTRLAWLQWHHPNMPWDGTELWLARLGDDGSAHEARRIAGGANESIFQPRWASDGTLYFVSDRSGWWNLYRFDGTQVHAVCPLQAEFGRPQWVFGLSSYDFLDARRIACTFNDAGRWRLGVIDVAAGSLRQIDLPLTEMQYLSCHDGAIYALVGGAELADSVARIDAATGSVATLRSSTTLELDARSIARPQAISYATGNGAYAHAYHYAPANHQVSAPPQQQAPLIVISHGGPTSSTSSSLSAAIQYWTTRGFAVLDVNYRGSSGYGRAYRQALDGLWGVADVDDCIAGAQHLVAAGLADAARLSIRGRSAGGYTTLAALTFHDVFKAGASYYGVSDLSALAQETHKFEARYMDRLVGPYPQQQERYRQRSPIHFAQQLHTPVIFFQGLEDKVVPPNQAERMVEVLRSKGIPVAYLAFEGEQHGFRRAATLQRTLEAELYFYSRVFGFALAQPVEPVAIDNLP